MRASLWILWAAVLSILPTLTEGVPSDPDLKAYIGYATECRGQPGENTSLEIMMVVPGSPADRAGLRAGDLVKAFNGVPFRFTKDSQVIRSMEWVEPGTPFEVTIVRDGDESTRTVVPQALEPEERARFLEWFRQFEANHDRSCDEVEGPLEIEWRVILDRVREAGGKASIIVERLEGDPATFQVSSPEIQLPRAFDWKAHWPSYDIIAQRLEPGQTFVVLIEAKDRFSSVDIRSDDVAISSAN